MRETWVPLIGEDQPDGRPNVVYAAHEFRSSSTRSGVDRLGSPREVPSWRPSIYMPRWASRLTLEVTEVRVQRLQEISEEDAKAEGCVEHEVSEADIAALPEGGQLRAIAEALGPGAFTAKSDFISLWDSINASKAPWDSNPWVWCVSFKLLRK